MQLPRTTRKAPLFTKEARAWALYRVWEEASFFLQTKSLSFSCFPRICLMASNVLMKSQTIVVRRIEKNLRNDLMGRLFHISANQFEEKR